MTEAQQSRITSRPRGDAHAGVGLAIELQVEVEMARVVLADHLTTIHVYAHPQKLPYLLNPAETLNMEGRARGSPRSSAPPRAPPPGHLPRADAWRTKRCSSVIRKKKWYDKRTVLTVRGN